MAFAYRTDDGKLLFGVCAGLAKKFGVAPLNVRIALVVLSLAFGLGLVTYILCFLLMPKERR